MCGRYVQTMPADAMRQLFRTTGAPPNLAPSWNVAPTQSAPVVRRHPETGERHLDLLRWGLRPRWVKDPKGAKQPINARAETVATSPMFREAFAKRRCFVPADAFYELNDPKCRGRYEALRARGHSYGRALRGVADRLLGVACVLLRRRTLFDPDHGAPAAP